MLNTFDKLKSSLTKTKDNLLGKISRIVKSRKIDDELLDEIEEILIEADVGVKATMRLVESVKEKARERRLTEGDEVMTLLREEISDILSGEDQNLFKSEEKKPVIWMIVGVNGVGKTTTIGKLATFFAKEGKKVLIFDGLYAALVGGIKISDSKIARIIVMSEKKFNLAAQKERGKEKVNDHRLKVLERECQAVRSLWPYVTHKISEDWQVTAYTHTP